MKIFGIVLLLFILVSCSSESPRKQENIIRNQTVVSWEFLVFSWILIDKNDFDKPISNKIAINPVIADLHLPQAWSREIEGKAYWYYNWDAAKIEAEVRQKRLPTLDEWKFLLSNWVAWFDNECVWFRAWWANIWSIIEKWWKDYWSSNEYIFNFDQTNTNYANIVSLYDGKAKCDLLWFFVRKEKWHGYSVRWIPIE